MKQLLVLLMLLCSSFTFAQDVIVKKDGSTILSKVLEVNSADIKYKKFSNLNGPTYTIGKEEIQAINYEIGEKDLFNVPITKNEQVSEQGYIYSKPDNQNDLLIAHFNKQYKSIDTPPKKQIEAKEFTIIFGIKTNSILSNNEIEMTFVLDKVDYYDDKYVIVLKNKTNKTIYIDKENSFRINNSGDFKSFFSESSVKTESHGKGSGT